MDIIVYVKLVEKDYMEKKDKLIFNYINDL